MLLFLPLMGQVATRQGAVAARQGTMVDVQQSEFSSPMVLELPMDRLHVAEPAGMYSFTDQGTFVCDDVSLPLIVVKKTVNEKAKRVELKIQSTAYVRPSFDRKVVLRYSIIRSGQALATFTEQEISAKEKKYRSDSSTLVMSKDEFDSLFEGGNHGVLKIVMMVTPDR
ncbi:hypothetical protein [Geothrix terrae]|uniref:hypothetical protein n=1 Tax=Geothrix terrae TaxID=2922720 RepID=UPI001FAE5112|nr:hypothetical protein [Geothrix terrae]